MIECCCKSYLFQIFPIQVFSSERNQRGPDENQELQEFFSVTTNHRACAIIAALGT